MQNLFQVVKEQLSADTTYYPFFRKAFETAPFGIDRIFPDITEKKSMESFIKRLANRATITLWEKPFQNMRSTRVTELIDIYTKFDTRTRLQYIE